MTIVSILDGHPDDATALIEGGQHTTYAELRVLRDQTRAGLVAAGVAPGDRVAILCGNTRSSVVSLLAVASGGMIATVLNPSSPLHELERQIATVDARLLLVGSEPPAGLAIDLATPAGTIVPGVDALADAPYAEPHDSSPDDVAITLFTSGTAGPPKAAMLTHRNLRFVQEALMAHADASVGPETVNLVALPLSHVYGLNVCLFTTLRAGGTVVLMGRFDPVGAADLVVEHGVTLFPGVPPMWRALVDNEAVDGTTFATIQRMTSGASALPKALFNDFKNRFGVELREGYGLTETASLATASIGGPVRQGSVGMAFPGIEVVVVDYDDKVAPFDDSGAVKVRGPNVFAGYWGDEEATKSVLDDEGWLRTGDVGVMSEDGFLYLVDRAKDLIIVSGFNVYPFEVEEVVAQHPSIDQCVVVGRDDDARGERIVAYVTLANGATAPTLDDVVDFCRMEIARYKCPSELHVVDQLPIAPSGKPIRRDLI
ncbi:MAG: AMP-binding protein [Acidimicrobiales bacterium]